MAIDLSRPLRWQSATHEEQRMLRALQGNILKGHGRPETTNLFFKFRRGQAVESRRALREIANYHLTSAYEQLLETQRFQQDGSSGRAFVAAYLSYKGYVAIDRKSAAPAGEPEFVRGMKHASSMAALGDPAPAQAHWEPPFLKRIDAMVLIGDAQRNQVRLERDRIVAIFEAAGATLVCEQAGSALKDKQGNGIEHFGYVDGRSQPLLLVEEIEKESRTAGIDRWDPRFGLSTVLVPDASPPDGISFGSYFVFRKLEQDVRGFKRREQKLATRLGLKNEDDREIAGALVVGRFEDGTPVTLSGEARKLAPPNNFDYSGDGGTRCPLQAHIRRVNPRGSSPDGAADERRHLMPRRGIPYEDRHRAVHPSDLPGCDSSAEFEAKVAPLLPTGGVGLLFMAYNARLTEQFVFTQAQWANGLGCTIPGAGIDPVIGEGSDSRTPGLKWPAHWDDPTSAGVSFDFHGFVTLRGGEYFFAPSLSFLKTL